MAEENRSTPEALDTAKELTLIEAIVETSPMDSHHADNPPSASENTKFSGANEKNATSAKTLYDDQNSESIQIKENTHIGAANEYEATQLAEYPTLVHRIHPNSPAVGATTPTHMDSGNIPGANNIHNEVQNHASIPPTAIQHSAATYSIPQQFNPGEVAGEPRFSMPGHSIPGQFIPDQTAGAVAPQFPTTTSSTPEQFIPSQASGIATEKSSSSIRRATCSFCQELGHRVDGCPFLPCKHCTNMGHVGRNCPTLLRNRNCRNWVAKCAMCEKPCHRRHECPSRPCRYCAVMGHVGRTCPIMTEKRTERKRKADAWRQAQ